MTHFFISYAKKDTRDLALVLNDALNAIHGVTAWVDKSLRAGPSWAAQIETQIDQCDYMIVLYSPDLNRHKLGLEESYVLNEIAYAKYTAKKPIIPIMAQQTAVPIDLARAHYIDFTTPGLTYAELVKAICDDAGVTLTIAPPADPVQSALDRSRNFKGTRNPDWTPFTHTFEAQGIPFEMCLVPPGRFQMGGDKYDNEKPIHLQTIAKPFWIARHPVTNAQWRAVVEQSKGEIKIPRWADWYNDKNKANHPVVGVTWFQCRDFTKWLGELWRLPTEAEWEYAARGVESWEFPWGNDFDPDRVIYGENSQNSTAAVGGRPSGASWVGAEDLSGNVWEWTSSLYQPYPYQEGDGREVDTAYRTSVRRVLRGSSFFNSEVVLRAPFRDSGDPVVEDDDIGFRCARF